MSNNENDHFNEEDIKASFLSAIRAYAESVPLVFELINKIEQHENHFTVNKDLETILKEIKNNNPGNNQNNQSVADLAISHMYDSLKDSDYLVKGTINRVSQYIDLYDIITKGIDSYPNPKVEIAKIVLSLALSVFAKNINPTHRFGGYFL